MCLWKLVLPQVVKLFHSFLPDYRTVLESVTVSCLPAVLILLFHGPVNSDRCYAM